MAADKRTGTEARTTEIPTAARTAVDAALVAAAEDLRADPQVLARMLGVLDETLRGIAKDAITSPGILSALGRLEAARQILAPHVEAAQESAGLKNMSAALRELYQVLGELYVRLFIGASTRDRQAPLVQMARDDVGSLRQRFGEAGGFGDPWHARHQISRIQAELMAMEVHDERSERALTDARRLAAEVLAITDRATQ